MDEPLPRHLTIPPSLYRWTLSRFLIECLPERHHETLVTQLRSEGYQPGTGEDHRQYNKDIRALTRRPFWQRAALVERWDRRMQLDLAARTRRLQWIGENTPYVRVSTKNFWRWLLCDPIPCRSYAKSTEWWIGRLYASQTYFAWLERGGSPDVGRYLGLWISRKAFS